jgi:hypothetical protein
MTNFAVVLLFFLIVILIVGCTGVVFRFRREIHAACKRIDSLGSQLVETACEPIENARVGDGWTTSTTRKPRWIRR